MCRRTATTPNCCKNGWFIHLADGTPIDGLPYDRAGSDIDTTNPDAAAWYWKTIRDNILSKGFDSLWADETEPDLPPNGAYFHIGPGTQFFNVYPLFHTGALYDGFRKDEPERRALILSRDAYLGVQRNGAIFWSSDIYPTWDTLQPPDSHRARFCGVGTYVLVERHRRMAVSSRGASSRRIRRCSTHRTRAPTWAVTTIIPSSTRAGSSTRRSCPSCAPTAAAAQTRSGPTASRPSRFWRNICACATELMPYIYSLGYKTWLTGAPFMRALPLDFPNDPKVADLRDEYMFGPAFLVAPDHRTGRDQPRSLSARGRRLVQLLDQRAREGRPDHHRRRAHRHHSALCPRGLDRSAGIVPGRKHAQKQSIAKVRVYPGADAEFTLFSDDGTTYAYEKGAGSITHLHWDDAGQQAHARRRGSVDRAGQRAGGSGQALGHLSSGRSACVCFCNESVVDGELDSAASCVYDHDGFAVGRKYCRRQTASGHDEFSLHGPGTRTSDFHKTICIHCDQKFAIGGEQLAPAVSTRRTGNLRERLKSIRIWLYFGEAPMAPRLSLITS